MTQPSWYDRDGHPIDASEWLSLRSHPSRYWFVGRDQVGDVLVSTIWVGLNYADHPDEPPLIFETGAFRMLGDGGREWLKFLRYATVEEARAGHEAVCAELRVSRDD